MRELSGGCRVFDPSDGELRPDGTCTWRQVICRATGTNRITQAVAEYRHGSSSIMVNPVAEEVLYVASGQGTCQIDAFPYDLHPGTGVYVPPGAEYSIDNPGTDALRIIHSCCPEDPSRHAVQTPRAAAAGEAPTLTVREENRETIRAGKDREFRYLVHRDLGCRQITQFVGLIPPSMAPFHHHEYEEAAFILDGRGIVHVEGEACEFRAGSSIYFPARVRHCVENPGTAAIRLLGAFYPSGDPGSAYEE